MNSFNLSVLAGYTHTRDGFYIDDATGLVCHTRKGIATYAIGIERGSDGKVIQPMQASDGSVYVGLEHGMAYKVRFVSTYPHRDLFELRIDGDQQISFNQYPNKDDTVERPYKVKRKFTFLRADSDEARSIGASVDNALNGLLHATYQNEDTKTRVSRNAPHRHGGYRRDARGDPDSMLERSAPMLARTTQGVTGLGERSNQEWNTEDKIEVNQDTRVDFHIRLVCVTQVTLANTQRYVGLKSISHPQPAVMPIPALAPPAPLATSFNSME